MTYLKRQIQLIKPKIIVALGGVAAVNLLQTGEAVGSLRQRLHDYEGIRTVVTYHPAYLLRKPADKKKSWDDLHHIRCLIEENCVNIRRADARKIKFYNRHLKFIEWWNHNRQKER